MGGNREDDQDEEDSPLEEIVAGAVIGLTMLVAFGLMAVGFPYFWIVFVVGFAGVLPMALGIVELYERRQEGDPTSDTEDALEELRERYARGEFSDAEFERRLERLLETESLDEAREFVDRAAEEHHDASAREREFELE